MKRFYKIFIRITFIFSISISNVFSEEIIKIGLLAPFTGESSSIGKSIIQSVRMGLNKIDDKRLIILQRDTKSNPKITFA